jgi:hypothetical protein
MSIDFSSIWNMIGLLGAIGSFIFYGARTFGKTVEQIERLSKAIDTLQQNLEAQTQSCKDGRVELWTEVNRMRERLTAVETIQNLKRD